MRKDMKQGPSFSQSPRTCTTGLVSAAFAATLLLPLFQAGCSTVFRSRVILDAYSTRDGMRVRNFSNDEADSFVRFFVLERGYEIRFAGSSDALVQGELTDDDSSLLWMAEKPDEPTVLFFSSETALTVSFVDSSFGYPPRRITHRAEVLSRILGAKYGRENVRTAGPWTSVPSFRMKIPGR